MKNLKQKLFVGLVAASTAVAGLNVTEANAQETIDITIIDGYPARSMWLQQISEFFIPEVDKRLAETGSYKINWQESYGGAIVKPKGVLEGVEYGLGDMGIVTTIFHASKLPSQSIASVTPFVSSDARVIAKAVDEIAREFPAMKNEFDKVNQVYLATGVVLDSYQLFMNEEVTSLAGLSGKKIYGAGMNLLYLEGLDDVAGVRAGLTEAYNIIQTGLVDGGMLWPEAAVTFKIAEVAPYMLRLNIGGVNSKTLTANKKFWNSLPDEVKTVLEEVAVEYRDQVANVAMKRAESSLEAYVAAGGTIIDIDPAEIQDWANVIPDVAAEWAANLDKRGEDGTGMMQAYLAKMDAAGQVSIRDWSEGLDK